MRRLGLVLSVLGVLSIVGCFSGSKSSSTTGSETSKGVTGQYWFVNLFTPPVGGTITSDLGGINCGASSTAVDQGVSPPQYVYAWYGAGATLSNHCGQTRFEWGQTVTLTANPQGTNTFLGWAGDCSGTGTCTLQAGADKSVVAIFGAAGSGHPNFMSPGVHGPAYFGFVSGSSALKCNTCHGADLRGQANAPSCFTCHEQAGWVGWQTNCSFCHGAKSAGAKAGYAFASHPDWSAPPDAISQRLNGVAAPDRTGAHQAHLLGVTPSGLSVASPFLCATCHPVPTDVSHISGASARANVVLSGAGQALLPASLGTYDVGTGTCTTYCHGTGTSPAWASTGMLCNGCHGVPPAAPHPYTGTDLTACAGCHAPTMKADGTIDITAHTHMDGTLQASGGHGDYTSPAVHGPKFFDSVANAPGSLQCNGCHGATYGGGIGPSCNACHASAGWTNWQTNCSFCHGERSAQTRPGYAVATHPTWSAPPDAVSQRLTGAPAPDRTGAHQAHLTGKSAAGVTFTVPFKCETCHAVPTDVSHIGGSTSRATVALAGAGQAYLAASLGTYDQATGTCTTYCHGATPAPAWGTGTVICGSCHGVPPAPSTGHPTVSGGLTACAGCHPETMASDGTIKVGSVTHVDGTVQAAGHGDYTSPATHGPAFFDSLRGTAIDCKGCHGATYGGGPAPSCNTCHTTAGWTGWQTNCSFCHGAKTPEAKAGYALATKPTLSAPPDDINSRLGLPPVAPERTGAHQTHLTGKGSITGTLYADPFVCQTCHTVPTDYAHAGGTGRAPVTLVGTRASLPASLGTYDAATGKCATYCHGNTLIDDAQQVASPPWWAGTELGCTGCHGDPPTTGQHNNHVNNQNMACAECHWTAIDYAGKMGAAHVDGVKTVIFASPGTTWNPVGECTSNCHTFPQPVGWN